MTPVNSSMKRWQWWLLVAVNIIFLVVGQAAATLLGRLYYDNGGNSKWLATLVQTFAFPILLIPLVLFVSRFNQSSINETAQTSLTTISSIYLVLGLIVAGDNLMYSYGLLYIPVSTYSLICASQLAFNVVFSYFLNSQKLTPYISNSVVLLTFSTALLATQADSDNPSGHSVRKYIIGFVCTLGASATYSLLLSLMQLTFQKVLKKENFSVVLEMQIYTAMVATIVCIVGLFASGEWKTLKGEMEGFKMGKSSYVMILIWTAISWQICSVGVVGLIFVLSSLFSNVISTLSLAILPVCAVIIFHDKMNGAKVIALLLALWGFASYTYQNYIDDSQSRKKKAEAEVSDSLA